MKKYLIALLVVLASVALGSKAQILGDVSAEIVPVMFSIDIT